MHRRSAPHRAGGHAWLGMACAALLGCGAHDLGPPRQQPAPSLDTQAPLHAQVAPRGVAYAIDAAFDADAHRVTGTVRVTWENRGQSAVDRVPFHLYLNAFKNEASLFHVRSHGEFRGADADAEGWGWIDVTSIKVGGLERRAEAIYVGPDETVLEVPVPRVEPGQRLEAELVFEAQLPVGLARAGYVGAFHVIAQWYPKLGRRVGSPGAERWACEPYHPFAEFDADFADYDLTLDVPSNHVVAATGVLREVRDTDLGRRQLRYRAEAVHDVVWIADPYLEQLSGQAVVGDRRVDVRVLARPAQRAFAERHLAAAIGAVEQFSELFVPYPWPSMTVVSPPPEAAEALGGMEYPMLVTTSGDTVLARPGVRLPEMVTIHEVGHNWFQGILASNEVDEPWLDEGVNEWADGIVMERLYGAQGSAIDWHGVRAEFFALRRAIEAGDLEVPTPIAAAARAFADFAGYGAVVYTKTLLALRTLEQHVGPAKFQAAMQAYAKAHAFAHPTGRDLIATWQTHFGEIDWFVRPMLYGVDRPELAVREVTCRPDHPPRGVFGDGAARRTVDAAAAPSQGAQRCTISLQNTGAPVVVELELTFADGSTRREQWDGRDGAGWHLVELQTPVALSAIELDPDQRLPIIARREELHVRIEPDTRASWRAAARIGFWSQTVMSAVGL